MKRLLTDTGPLVALLDASDAANERCVDHLRGITSGLVTTWPVVTESMYLLGHHWEAQKTLLEMIASDDLTVLGLDGIIGRTQSLMTKYRDVPMDFADASLVAVAEKNHWDTIFTLDTDFRVYRLGGRRAFQVVP